MNAPNFYVGDDIDRLSEMRGDADWLAVRMADPDSLVIPVWRNRNLVTSAQDPAPVLVTRADWPLSEQDDPILLGAVGGTICFAIDLSHLDEPPLVEGGAFCDLREIGPLLSREDGALLAYGRGITTWQRRHRHCGTCGSPTTSEEAGHMRRCEDASCRTPWFPRTDPAVIMLVHDGGDRCVLGRQAVWRAGQHSVLAGFVEPGESLECAVAREVFEEVGVETVDIVYQSSQPWPFPSSIMLGFRARAVGDALAVNTDELEGARWFTIEEILSCPGDESFRLPRTDSISRRLIEDWISERA